MVIPPFLFRHLLPIWLGLWLIGDYTSAAMTQPLADLMPSPGSARALLTAAEREFLQYKGAITYCPDPAWLPLEGIAHGKHVGMSRDYVAYVQQALDIPFILIACDTWSEAIIKAKQRQCDVWTLAMATPEREQYMRFTRSYLNVPLVVATRAQALFFTDINQLYGKPLGVSKGYAFVELLRRNHPQLNLIEVSNVTTGLEEVARGRLFGMIDTLASIGYHIQRDYLGELVIAGKFEERWILGMAARSDEPLLVSILDKTLVTIPPELHDRVLSQWVAVSYQSAFKREWLWQGGAVLFTLLAFVFYRYRLMLKYNRQLRHLTETDPLTQLYNRLKLDTVLLQEIGAAAKYRFSLAVILLDIDHFKAVNDKYGHLIGDAVLKEIAHILQQNVRQGDSCGRWGGEEFLIVCPNTNDMAAIALAERLRNQIVDYVFSSQQQQTASFGIAVWQSNETIASLIGRADAALYQAKHQGRNQVVQAE